MGNDNFHLSDEELRKADRLATIYDEIGKLELVATGDTVTALVDAFAKYVLAKIDRAYTDGYVDGMAAHRPEGE